MGIQSTESLENNICLLKQMLCDFININSLITARWILDQIIPIVKAAAKSLSNSVVATHYRNFSNYTEHQNVILNLE